MTRKPSLDETDARPDTGRDAPPDSLTYWQKRERWAELGRRVGELRREAKTRGVPLETLSGARALVAAFQTLGRELDRRAR